MFSYKVGLREEVLEVLLKQNKQKLVCKEVHYLTSLC